ncbi:hypothetical protein AB4142_38065, partial [Variovorax sp. 2RAF20]
LGAERQIANVAAGTEATDAVNKGQLDVAIAGVGGAVGDLDAAAVKYDDAAGKERVTLGGSAGTVIANVGNGVNAGDAA